MGFWKDKGKIDGARGGAAVYNNTDVDGVPYGAKTLTDVSEYYEGVREARSNQKS